MAEFVEERIEQQLPVFQHLKETGLLKRKEIKIMIQRAKEFEYKLQRRQKHKEDYTSYIQHDLDLLALIRKRRERFGYFQKKEEIDNILVRRIVDLFRSAVQRFSLDLTLWNSYIDLLKHLKWRTAVSQAYIQCLRSHSSKPEVWLAAAKWEMEELESPDSARKLMLRAIGFHKDSTKLYTEFFKLELAFALQQRQKFGFDNSSTIPEECPEKDLLRGKVAEIVYKNAMQILPDPAVAMSFLDILKDTDFPTVRENIYQHLTSTFPNSEEVQCLIARRCLLRDSDSGKISKSDIAECREKFEASLREIPTRKMCKFYLTTCMELLQMDGLSPKQVQKQTKLTLRAFHIAATDALLDEDLFSTWLELLHNVGSVDPILPGHISYEEEVEFAIATGLQSFPKSISLHQQSVSWLSTHSCDTNKIMDAFARVVDTISGKKSVPIWEQFVRWAATTDDKTAVSVFKRGLQSSSAVARRVKVWYLHWAMLSKERSHVQGVYEQIWNTPPITLDVFLEMYRYNMGPDKDIDSARSVLQQGCQHFGSTSIDLWLMRLNLESEHNINDALSVSRVYNQAVKTLDSELLQTFMEKATLLDVKRETPDTNNEENESSE